MRTLTDADWFGDQETQYLNLHNGVLIKLQNNQHWLPQHETFATVPVSLCFVPCYNYKNGKWIPIVKNA